MKGKARLSRIMRAAISANIWADLKSKQGNCVNGE